MSEQRFCLRWNHHQTTLINVFDSLLKDESLVDVTLYAEGQPVKAHKVVLSACSPYFKTIFSAHTESHPVIIINNVLHSELRALVDYMYRGEVNVCQDQLSSFIKAAESLKIKGLADGGERRAAAPAPASAPPSPPPPAPVPFQTTPLRAASPHAVRESPLPPAVSIGGGARPDQPNGRISPPPAKRPRPASVDSGPSTVAMWDTAARPASAEGRSEAAHSPGPGAGLPRIPATITPLAAGRRPEQAPSPPAAAPQPPPPPAMPLQPPAAELAAPPLDQPPVKLETPPGRGGEDVGPESDAELDGVDGVDPGPSGRQSGPTPPHPAAAPAGFLNWPLGGADGADSPFGGAASEAGTPQDAYLQQALFRRLLEQRRYEQLMARAPPPPPPGTGLSPACLSPGPGPMPGLVRGLTLPPMLRPGAASSPARQYNCERCGRQYTSSGNLKRHVKYECGVEPQFQCPVCKKKFQHRHSVKIHVVSTHKTENPELIKDYLM